MIVSTMTVSGTGVSPVWQNYRFSTTGETPAPLFLSFEFTSG